MPATVWALPEPSSAPALSPLAVAGLLSAQGSAAKGSAQALCGYFAALVPVDHASVVQHGCNAASRQMDGHSRLRGQRNITRECFERYAQGFWRSDTATLLAQRLRERGRAAAQAPVALHLRLNDIPEPAWRRDIYEREGLGARFSVLWAPEHGPV